MRLPIPPIRDRPGKDWEAWSKEIIDAGQALRARAHLIGMEKARLTSPGLGTTSPIWISDTFRALSLRTLEAYVHGITSAGGYAIYVKRARYLCNSAGVVSLIGSVIDVDTPEESDAAANCAFFINTNGTVQLEVTDAAVVTSWTAVVYTYEAT